MRDLSQEQKGNSYKLRKKIFLNTLYLAIIIGFIVGMIISFIQITYNGYLRYKMYKLVTFIFLKSLNQWIFLIILTAFILGLTSKLICKYLFPKIFDLHIREKNVMASIISAIFLVSVGWAINYYFLPYKFHPISLISDLGILLFALFLWRTLVRTKLDNIINTLYLKRIAVALIIITAMLNLYNVIDNKTKLKGPNVILISIETTRADHLSCYGYERNTSPTIDNLANESVLFSNMFAQRGLTWPSLTSIMTSLYPVKHHVRDNGHMLPFGIISLAEILKNNSYRCGAFLTNAYMARWRGFDYKWDRAEDDIKVTQKAIRWLKNNHKKKIFLWIHYWQPHSPYQPPEPYNSIFDPNYTGAMNGSREQMNEISLKKIQLKEKDLNQIISLYDGSILFVDDQIGQLLATIKNMNLEENSIIIITSDHGEDLYEHNCYFYHQASIYDSSLHIPFIIKLPNNLSKKIRIDEIVESIDIAPTILELLKIPIPRHFEGTSLTQLIFKKDESNNFGYAYSEWNDKILSIRTNKYRYIYNPTNFHPRPIAESADYIYPIDEEELYNIKTDRKESMNIISTNFNVGLKLMKKLAEWNNFEYWMTQVREKEKKIPEHILERLRSLGYIK